MDKSDEQYLGALKSISAIEVRPMPTGKPYNFSEEFSSDVRQIETFCKEKRLFARNSRYISERWDVVCLLSPKFFVYHLPPILLAMLEYPKSNLSKALVGGKLVRLQSEYSTSEARAIKDVLLFLDSFGINPTSVKAKVRQGKELAMFHRETWDGGEAQSDLNG